MKYRRPRRSDAVFGLELTPELAFIPATLPHKRRSTPQNGQNEKRDEISRNPKNP